MKGKTLFVCLGIVTLQAAGVDAADLVLNEYNAVQASRWLECDGLDCPTCGGPPCKEDIVFGRVQGNGGNWIELVVTGNHVDLRGWQLNWTENPSDAGTLTLTDDPLWADLRAGTIITFTELDATAGGLDTDTSYDPSGGDWWININTLSSDGTPQTQYVTTVTNVVGDGPGAFSVGKDNWQLTILDADSNVAFGPCGEGIRFECNGGSLDGQTCPASGICDGGICEPVGVNSREIFKLQEDPTPEIDPGTSNYKDGTTSTFGHPNVWRGGDRNQDFTCIRCDDGVFCNGIEACNVDGVCQPGAEPCQDLAHCDESASSCLECIDGGECDDGNSCTENRCDGGTCNFVAIPGCGGPVTPPDADGDGIVDARDECPGTPDQETVDDAGCSCSQLDEDGDAVDDCTDECPETPAEEVANEQGCSCSQLDDDGDDVDDCTDECADTPAGEAADDHGCSCGQLDADADGVNDCWDQCSRTPTGESVDAEGCSCFQLDPEGDDDGDGVLNCLDRCENTVPGDGVDSEGCSCMQLDPDSDSDGDGVPDCLDLCPATSIGASVDDTGCGVEVPDDTPAPAEVPDGEGGDGDTNATEGSGDGEVEDTVDPQDRRCLCGLIGLAELAWLLGGLVALRFSRCCGGR